MNAQLQFFFWSGLCAETKYNRENIGGNRKSHETVPFFIFFTRVPFTCGINPGPCRSLFSAGIACTEITQITESEHAMFIFSFHLDKELAKGFDIYSL
jgi:hypothetical protein